MSTNMKSLDKENEVGPTTPKTLMKKQLYHGNNHVGNGKPNRSQARRVKRLPLASKDSNRTSSGISFNKNDSKGLSRNSSIHLKKYGSILYQGNNNNINTLNKNSLPKVKSLVLKDIDDNDNDGNSSTSSDTDEDTILQSIKQGLSKSNKGLSELLEENEMKTKDDDNDDLDIEFAPLREKEIEYIPDGIDVLQIDDLQKLNDINIEPMTFDLGLDQDNGPNNMKGSLLMDLQSVSDYDNNDNDNDIGMSLQPHTHRDKHHNRTDIEIDTSDIDSVYHGHGLDADDIADLLAD